ncbi:hydroxyacid-oxoacid transhydrogenase [Natronosalvus rutilus]|uniref:hydroxyacid-oxoacid transhydrogenase n=1 Tax=Natronosalvus rutilus TaxID=2953753 RepID=A0A9E7SZ95_9EURY|nr:hydroxyacid-oxoacid transhydrogenase [Natronosalvus rutilus]UTF55753.1 iron-containing alcohol dehydrogenase [Natronosalvus rutilus]
MFDPETVWTFDAADRVSFGVGAAEELSDELDAFKPESVLFVSDAGVVDAGIVSHLTEQLPANLDYEVYGEVEPEPDVDVFRDALEYARDVGPDVVVGVGGGSAMDAAKTIGALIEADDGPLSYVAPPTGDGKAVPESGRPTVCVPTTAGTGAETSPATVISLPDRDTKVGISSRYQYPDLALLDPTLTVSLPPAQTASSGMDALAQAIEAYTVRRFDQKPRAQSPGERPDYGGRTPLTDSFALQAIDLLSENIRSAVGNGENLDARSGMLLGSFLAGLAYTNAGVTVNHAMAMAIGGKLHSPHGVTVAALLPASLEYNAAGLPERHERIAERLGVECFGDEESAGKRAATAVRRLASDLDLPDGLSSFGATPADVTPFAERTMQLERLTSGNPRGLSLADIEAMIERSL